MQIKDAERSKRCCRKPDAIALALLAPSLIGVAVFFLIPTLDVVRRSVVDDSSVRFIGADNFIDVLGNEAFKLAAVNTAKFVFFAVPILLMISLGVALYVSRSTPFRRFAKTILLVPLAIPTFTVALLISLLFDASGLVNGLVVAFGGEPVPWLESDWAFVVLLVEFVWKNIGYCMVLWLAGLACIPSELYEAAALDGASAARCFTHITLPLLFPSAAVVVILALVNAFKTYREAYLIAGSYPPESIYLIPHLFNNWFTDLSMGKLAAGSVLLIVVLGVIVLMLSVAWRKRNQQ